MNKALILAAGLGSRLKHRTVALPKALVPVHGAPILTHQLRALAANGIDRVGIVLGHAGERIIEFVNREHPELAVEYFWNRDYQDSNSSYSFWQARDWVRREPYVHINCDIIFSPDLLTDLIRAPYGSAIAIRRDIPLGDQMENVATRDGRIAKMSIKHFADAEGKAYGLAKIAPAEVALMLTEMEIHLQRGNRNENCYGLIRQVIDGGAVFAAIDASGRTLYEVNTLVDLDSVETQLAADSLAAAPADQ